MASPSRIPKNPTIEANNKSLWQSYKSLSPRLRLGLGLFGIAFSFAGIYVSDRLEEKKPQDSKPEL
ncbi:hypothetical protein K7432_012325 [Basidiobolus ranarum]|uniref:Uncharacterized protein n=1 Tax=Basidiobolus ranarum TaxID=34480 RepID=A0ABR2VSE7_9FUNG